MSEHIIEPHKSNWERFCAWCGSWSPQVKQAVIAGAILTVLTSAGWFWFSEELNPNVKWHPIAATNIMGSAVFEGNGNTVAIDNSTHFGSTNVIPVPTADALASFLKKAETEEKVHAFAGRLETQEGFSHIYFIGSSGAGFFVANSGSLLDLLPPPFHSIAEQNSFSVDGTADGTLRVSAKVRGRDGLLAEIVSNEWKVAPPPKTWDRNYSTNALEIKDADGEIVFQVILTNRFAHFQGIFFGVEGNGFALTADPKGGAWMTFLQKGFSTMPQIKPLFRYPSDLHLGELVER